MVEAPVFNSFEVFRLPLCFKISLDDLDRRFRRLQDLCHPDRARGSFDRDIREKKSIAITKAYTILRCPVKRAQSLLMLCGESLDASTVTSVEASFLIEVLELQEKFQEGTYTRDMLQQELQSILKSLENSFSKGNFQEAKIHLRYYQFLIKLGTPTHALTAP